MKFVKAVCLLGCCYGVFMNIALQKHDRLSAFIFLSCSIVLGGISFFESNRYWNRLRDLRSGTQSTEAVEVLYRPSFLKFLLLRQFWFLWAGFVAGMILFVLILGSKIGIAGSIGAIAAGSAVFLLSAYWIYSRLR